jgi:hypothetical protein
MDPAAGGSPEEVMEVLGMSTDSWKQEIPGYKGEELKLPWGKEQQQREKPKVMTSRGRDHQVRGSGDPRATAGDCR